MHARVRVHVHARARAQARGRAPNIFKVPPWRKNPTMQKQILVLDVGRRTNVQATARQVFLESSPKITIPKNVSFM